LHAYYVQHAYPPHSHDYYVISLIDRGLQPFTHKGKTDLTPQGGVILINPGEVHTGEAADQNGFELRSLYPSIQLMQAVIYELTGKPQSLPLFRDVRIDHPQISSSILSLHKAIAQSSNPLEAETRLLWTLTQLLKHYANSVPPEQKINHEKTAIQRARRYIEEHFREGISLHQLAQHVALSPYYFLRAFHAEVGMPPYVYLESVRIARAQKLIERGLSLAEVAIETGFSSQSHLTYRFKKIIGTTPGQYAQQFKF